MILGMSFGLVSMDVVIVMSVPFQKTSEKCLKVAI